MAADFDRITTAAIFMHETYVILSVVYRLMSISHRFVAVDVAAYATGAKTATMQLFGRLRVGRDSERSIVGLELVTAVHASSISRRCFSSTALSTITSCFGFGTMKPVLDTIN